MEKKEKAPVLRFKDTNGKDYPAWEQRKLGDIGTVQMNKRIFKTQTSTSGEIPFYKIGTFGKIPDAYISRELFEEYKKKYPYPKKGDLLLSASGSIGNVVEYNGEEAYFQDSNIVWLEHGKTISNFFLKAFYSVVNWEGIEGTTIKRLYNKTILDTPITLPSFEEQEKIGNFFTVLDKVITLHQRKLEALKKLKRTLLQKMFPKKGHLKPELRFFGFTNDWEQRKFQEITQRVSTSSISSIDFPSVEYEDIEAGSGTLNKDVKLKEKNKKGTVFNKNDILFGKLRPYLMNWLLADFKGVAVGDFWVLRSQNCDPKFVYSLIHSKSFQEVANRSSGSKMPRADWNLVSNTLFFVPSQNNEQRKIGELFSSLDKVITLHQRKLEIYKKLKKGLLQKMFI